MTSHFIVYWLTWFTDIISLIKTELSTHLSCLRYTLLCNSLILSCDVQVRVEEYLRDPSGDNLLGLGGARAELVAASMGVSDTLTHTHHRLYT